MSDSTESGLDWVAARAFLRVRLRRSLVAEDSAVIDELTQEAMVRLLRAVRRQEVRNLEALMNVIADRTRVDHIRAQRARMNVFQPMDSATADVPEFRPRPAAAVEDLGARLQFAVLEYFHLHNPRCRELALHYFAERDWTDVARKTGRKPEAVRQQWSRCVKRLAAGVAGSAEPLWIWARAWVGGGGAEEARG
jgi:RNA polymerase sigma factor (sigma-70 family)